MALLNDLRDFALEAWKLRREDRAAFDRAKLVEFFPAWRRSLAGGASPIRDEQPWIVFQAIKFLDENLGPAMKVFEYGSGGSTLFLSKRVKEVNTIENDPGWASQVQAILGQTHRSNVRIHLVEPEADPDGRTKDPSDPAAYCSGAPAYKGYSFQKYVSTIDSFPDQYFDAVLVDGRARPSCCQHARAKVAVGGWLLLDNTERNYYGRVHAMLDNPQWRRFNFRGPLPYYRPFTQTCLWQRLG